MKSQITYAFLAMMSLSSISTLQAAYHCCDGEFGLWLCSYSCEHGPGFNNNCVPEFKKCPSEMRSSPKIDKHKINIITREQLQKLTEKNTPASK